MVKECNPRDTGETPETSRQPAVRRCVEADARATCTPCTQQRPRTLRAVRSDGISGLCETADGTQAEPIGEGRSVSMAICVHTARHRVATRSSMMR